MRCILGTRVHCVGVHVVTRSVRQQLICVVWTTQSHLEPRVEIADELDVPRALSARDSPSSLYHELIGRRELRRVLTPAAEDLHARVALGRAASAPLKQLEHLEARVRDQLVARLNLGAQLHHQMHNATRLGLCFQPDRCA